MNRQRGGKDGELVLAIDQGGHASRAILFDARGEPCAEAFAPLATSRPKDGWVEHDAESLLASVRTAIAEALSGIADRARLRAAGLATQRSSIVCWDRRTGEALSPVISWQDRRNAGWLERMQLDPIAVRETTGLVISPHYGASKLGWCLEHLPAVRAARAAGTLAAGPVSSFLLHRLIDARPLLVDPANASRTLLWDYRRRDWSQPLLDAFDIPRAVLPRCAGSRHPFGALDIRGARIPLEVCTGDQSAVPFAFGEPRADTAYINIGTGAFIQRLIGQAPDSTRGLLVSVAWQYAAEAVYALEGTVNGAGSALDRIGPQLGIDPAADFDPGNGEPPLFLNGVSGLGSPYWQPHFESRFVGTGDAGACLHAVLESIAFLVVENLRLMQEQAGPLAVAVVTGGLACRDALCRMLADLGGLAVLRPDVREATARGLAWLVAGRPAGWQAAARRFEPSPVLELAARHARWQAAMRAAGACADPV